MSMHEYINNEWKITQVSGSPPDGAKEGHVFKFKQKGSTNDIDPTESPNAPDWSAAEFLTYDSEKNEIWGCLTYNDTPYSIHLRTGKWWLWSVQLGRFERFEGLTCYYHATSTRPRPAFRRMLPARFAQKLFRLHPFLRFVIFAHSGVWHAPD